MELTFRFGDVNSSQEEQLAEKFAQAMLEMWPEDVSVKRQVIKRDEGHRWKAHVTSQKTKDMTLLTYCVRQMMQITDCTFSWNKKVFELSAAGPAAAPHGKEERSTDGIGETEREPVGELLFRDVIDRIAAAAAGDSKLQESLNASQRIIITTDGRLSSVAPAKVDSDGKTLTINATKLEDGKDEHWWIRIDDLDSP